MSEIDSQVEFLTFFYRVVSGGKIRVLEEAKVRIVVLISLRITCGESSVERCGEKTCFRSCYVEWIGLSSFVVGAYPTGTFTHTR